MIVGFRRSSSGPFAIEVHPTMMGRGRISQPLDRQQSPHKFSLQERQKEENQERSGFSTPPPSRSVSAPPRRRWFTGKGDEEPVRCDELTRKLVSAIAAWHDIHSNLLRLSLENSTESLPHSSSSISSSTDESEESPDEEFSQVPSTSRFSISNPELTSLHVNQMFPELSEHWSRPTQTQPRSRVHSDGSDDASGADNSGRESDTEEEPRFELEITCSHCRMAAEYRRRILRTELESAVMRLARRLGSNRQVRDVRTRPAPDIIVSSISSDEEDSPFENHPNSAFSTSLQTSEAGSPCCSTPTSPRVSCNGGIPPSPDAFSATLRPPPLLLPSSASDSPPRSNSVDLSTLRRDLELISVSSGESDIGDFGDCAEPPTPAESTRTARSRSHDPQAPCSILRRPSRIEHLSELFRKALAKSPVVRRSAEHEVRTVNKHRTSRYWVDDQVLPAEHLWLPSSSSSTSADTECYVGEKDCRKEGEKRRCAACHIVAHSSCVSLLSRLNLNCKTTFRECCSPRKPPCKELMDSLTLHHWVHKWRHEGRCNACGKSFQQKMFNFQQKEKKETIAVTCSWCKESYHMKNCFTREKLEQKCDRGSLREMIIPPCWILRLPVRKRKMQKQPSLRTRRLSKQFVVKPNDLWTSGPTQPLLVFVNPKSGGNKGSKALHTLCWLLNPRQVFDITSLKGPKYGLEVYRKVVTQLRLLVCGGDGTVGWVLQTLDNLNWPAYPPMAIMPLGTGNDLSRCMGWGGTFSDEPLSQLLQAILHETTVTHLDRWRIEVSPNAHADLDAQNEELPDAVQSSLPLTVMNNYFSIGADAHVALQFHHSRSANPQMLNSRLKNRIAYGGLGTIDLFKRSWKDLTDYVQLECDGVDITPRLKELKLHCILFHNISYYAGGTVPWGSDVESNQKPSCCDGKIEVLGFTTATLAALQMGGKGERITQCSTVRVITNKAIPMQVDGEPCLLAPSVITLAFHSKVPMLRRDKKTACTPNLMRRNTRAQRKDSRVQSTSLFIQLPVVVVGRHDYDALKDCFERLKDTAYEIGTIKVESECELASARKLIHQLLARREHLPYEPSREWRFLDYVTNAEEGTFRVSRHQESVHSVSDVCNPDECLLILDDSFPSMTIAKEEEFNFANAAPASSSSSQTPPPCARRGRRISETLRIVLCSDAQETHL